MKQEPKFDKQELNQFILKEYGTRVKNMRFVPLGENSFAYILDTGKEKKFLKMFSEARVQKRVAEKLHKNLKVVSQLHELGINNISYPLPTKKGNLHSKFKNYSIVLFNYIMGKSSEEPKLNKKQQINLGKTIALVHKSTDNINLNKIIFKEPRIRFEADLKKCILESDKKVFSGYKEKIRKLIEENRKEILEILEKLKVLEEKIEKYKIKEVICHKDPIGLNLIINKDSISIIDWDGLDLAPKEQDLWFYIFENYFHVFKEYKKNFGKFQLNKELIHFYFLHRILEDLIDWAYQAFFEPMDEKEIKRTYLGLVDWPTKKIKNYKEELKIIDNKIRMINCIIK